MRWPEGLDIGPSGLGDLGRTCVLVPYEYYMRGDLITIKVDLVMGLLQFVFSRLQSTYPAVKAYNYRPHKKDGGRFCFYRRLSVHRGSAFGGRGIYLWREDGVCLWRGTCMEGADPLLLRYCQLVVSTHPTGMYSCF